MKVVNYDDEEDLLNNDAVSIDEMSITYMQPADTNSCGEETQYLKITTRTAVCITKEEVDAGDKRYYYDIELPEGGHWSIDSSNAITELIKDFETRLYLTQEGDGNTDNQGL